MKISNFKILDEYNTPKEAVEILLPHLKPNSLICCPFDKPDSNFVKVLKEAGHRVWSMHYDPKTKDGIDFFSDLAQKIIEDNNFDYIISNPPWSIKDLILKRLYEIGIPFAMLLPTYAIGGNKRYELFANNGLELLIPKQRIKYINDNLKPNNHPAFHSSYFCWKILSERIIFTQLKKDET